MLTSRSHKRGMDEPTVLDSLPPLPPPVCVCVRVCVRERRGERE